MADTYIPNSTGNRKLIDNGDGTFSDTTSMATKIAGEDLTNDVLKVRTPATYTNLSASALIKTGAGVVSGFIVNSHSSGTLKLWDNTSAATTLWAFTGSHSVFDWIAQTFRMLLF